MPLWRNRKTQIGSQERLAARGALIYEIEMSDKEQIDHFANDLDALVKRYSEEYDIPYASVVGVLQMKAWLLCADADVRSDEV
jgi:hypothetical protein